MILHRRPGGCVVSKAKLAEILANEDCDERAVVSRRRRVRRVGNDIKVRVVRAEALVQRPLSLPPG